MVDERADGGAASILLRRLERHGPLSEQEKRAILTEPLAVRQIGADRDLVFEGERPSAFPFLLDGFACGYKILENGQRQIVAFHIPLDICDLASVHLGIRDASIATLTQATVAFISHGTILAWSQQHPALGLRLWQASLIEAAALREWIVNVGRRSAYERTAHLLCELAARMRAAGLARGAECSLPLTQLSLADAMGLTPVHVNRTLQWLRGEGLIKLGSGRLTIPDWESLKRAGGFDARYLHGKSSSNRNGHLASATVPGCS